MNPTRSDLEAAGYESLTYEYFLPQDRWMFVRAVEQLAKGRRDYKVVETDTTREIFVRKQHTNY